MDVSKGAPNRMATDRIEADMFPVETCMFQARCMFRDNQQISDGFRGLTGHMSLLSFPLCSPHVPLPTLIISPVEPCLHTCHHHSVRWWGVGVRGVGKGGTGNIGPQTLVRRADTQQQRMLPTDTPSATHTHIYAKSPFGT